MRFCQKKVQFLCIASLHCVCSVLLVDARRVKCKMHQSFVLSLLFTLLVLVFSPVALAQDESDSDDIGDLTACTGLPAESVCGCIVNTSNSTSMPRVGLV